MVKGIALLEGSIHFHSLIMQREEDSSFFFACPDHSNFPKLFVIFRLLNFSEKMAIAWARCPSTFSSIAIKLTFY